MLLAENNLAESTISEPVCACASTFPVRDGAGTGPPGRHWDWAEPPMWGQQRSTHPSTFRFSFCPGSLASQIFFWRPWSRQKYALLCNGKARWSTDFIARIYIVCTLWPPSRCCWSLGIMGMQRAVLPATMTCHHFEPTVPCSGLPRQSISNGGGWRRSIELHEPALSTSVELQCGVWRRAQARTPNSASATTSPTSYTYADTPANHTHLSEYS